MGIKNMIGDSGCEHQWKIFNDGELKNKGFLSFYCINCLELRKVKKVYPNV